MIQDVLPPFTVDQIKGSIRNFMREAASVGITTVHDPLLILPDAKGQLNGFGVGKNNISAFAEMAHDGELTLRVRGTVLTDSSRDAGQVRADSNDAWTSATRWLESLREEQRSLVLFESSHRVEASLADMIEIFGDQREAAICRELTKRFETVLRGTLGELLATVSGDPNQRKGEFVVVISGASGDHGVELSKAIQLGRSLQSYLTTSQSARVAAKIYPVSRRDVYERLQQDSEGPDR